MTNFPKKDLPNKLKENKTDKIERLESENRVLRQELERIMKEISKLLNVLNPFK